MLQRLADRPLGLAERALGCGRRAGQGSAEGLDEEPMGLLVEREGRRLAGQAHHAAGRAGEAGEVLALPARGTGAELGRPAPPGAESRSASSLQSSA